MDHAEAQAMVDAIVDELLPRTRLTDRDTVHVEVRELEDVDAFSQVWRRPGWDTALAEARDGEAWDIDPEAKMVVTTGLIAALTRSQLRAVVAHELAHIEAGDHLSQEWVTGRRSRRREQRRDLRAVEICGDGAAVAGALLRLFREVLPESRDHIGNHGAAGTRANVVGSRMVRDLGL